jgi:hypothetical protein
MPASERGQVRRPTLWAAAGAWRKARRDLGHFTETGLTRIHLPFKFDMRLIKFLLVSRIHLMSTGATQKPQERCFQGRGA